MESAIKSSYVNEWDTEDQLTFYKERFELLHCQLDACGHEVRNDWAIYNSELYCNECYEWKLNDDRERAKVEIEQKEIEIAELRYRYDLGEED